ncbi:hypothetical protein BV22DRAFT_776193 [Leucogyrophana mollusca]|uniref:Uncharacterized protein n=1 Tax=Leucogyrophana mollusca TaxID=85980 RepID=A0ACB8B5K4_9AGAM|nr:hypothetical protein BV22DRAFT_776193 [Leucogyrophana mollusca]
MSFPASFDDTHSSSSSGVRTAPPVLRLKADAEYRMIDRCPQPDILPRRRLRREERVIHLHNSPSSARRSGHQSPRFQRAFTAPDSCPLYRPEACGNAGSPSRTLCPTGYSELLGYDRSIMPAHERCRDPVDAVMSPLPPRKPGEKKVVQDRDHVWRGFIEKAHERHHICASMTAASTADDSRLTPSPTNQFDRNFPPPFIRRTPSPITPRATAGTTYIGSPSRLSSSPMSASPISVPRDRRSASKSSWQDYSSPTPSPLRLTFSDDTSDISDPLCDTISQFPTPPPLTIRLKSLSSLQSASFTHLPNPVTITSERTRTRRLSPKSILKKTPSSVSVSPSFRTPSNPPEPGRLDYKLGKSSLTPGLSPSSYHRKSTSAPCTGYNSVDRRGAHPKRPLSYLETLILSPTTNTYDTSRPSRLSIAESEGGVVQWGYAL